MTIRRTIFFVAAGLGSIVLSSQALAVLVQVPKLLGNFGEHSTVIPVQACKFPYVSQQQSGSSNTLCVHHMTIPLTTKSKATAPKQSSKG